MTEIPSSARVYLRPAHFVDSPAACDGRAHRLAGGMQWFAACELIVAQEGRRIARSLRAVADLPDDPRVEAILARLTAPRAPLVLGDRTLRFDQPQAMGILNVTPDSFSDGGAHWDDPAAAARAGFDMAAAGAAVIDVGGESTRPGAAEVWEGDEIGRVAPVIGPLVRGGAIVSIDTRKPAVMAAALAEGAQIVNDVSGLAFDPRSIDIVARAGCPVVLMHSPDAKGGHSGAAYGDVLLDVYEWLEARVAAVAAAGVDRARILVDPGIGFGKSLADNLALMNGLALFHGLGCPILLGASRKRLIGALSGEAPTDQRLAGSVALALKGAELGVQLLRVHDVFETVQALRVWRGMRDAALVAGYASKLP